MLSQSSLQHFSIEIVCMILNLFCVVNHQHRYPLQGDGQALFEDIPLGHSLVRVSFAVAICDAFMLNKITRIAALNIR